MGYFKEEQLKKLKLKTNPEYWVEVLADLRYGDIKKFGTQNPDGEVDFAASGDLFLLTVIKSWNLDDDAGTVLPITAENIDRLEKDDVMLIINEAGGLVEDSDSKKNSSNQSSAPSTATS